MSEKRDDSSQRSAVLTVIKGILVIIAIVFFWAVMIMGIFSGYFSIPLFIILILVTAATIIHYVKNKE